MTTLKQFQKDNAHWAFLHIKTLTLIRGSPP